MARIPATISLTEREARALTVALEQYRADPPPKASAAHLPPADSSALLRRLAETAEPRAHQHTETVDLVGDAKRSVTDRNGEPLREGDPVRVENANGGWMPETHMVHRIGTHPSVTVEVTRSRDRGARGAYGVHPRSVERVPRGE